VKRFRVDSCSFEFYLKILKIDNKVLALLAPFFPEEDGRIAEFVVLVVGTICTLTQRSADGLCMQSHDFPKLYQVKYRCVQVRGCNQMIHLKFKGPDCVNDCIRSFAYA
jgi:hypothetical protein